MGVEPLPVETQPQNRSRVRAAQGSVGSCPPWTQANQMGGGSTFTASCLSWPYKFFVTRWVL